MENVHLAPSDDDDIYTGYGDYHPALDTQDLEKDEGFLQALKTSYSKRPPLTGRVNPPGTAAARFATASGLRAATGVRGATSLRTSHGAMQEGGARPMTAVRGVGYSSHGNRAVFDPLNQNTRRSASILEKTTEDTIEEKIKQIERKVNDLVEASCMSTSRGDIKVALEKAKEAAQKERLLVRQKEQASMSDQHNLDLTFTVLFNLANQYAANDMHTEALNTYQVIVKNRLFQNAGRLKVNMGNIYFQQGNYPKAIKFYRMALDQVPNIQREMRLRIMHNIGSLFVRMAQYTDAVTSFEYIMNELADFKTALNLILCYYALGDREKMKKGFMKMLNIALDVDEDDQYATNSDDPHFNLIVEAIKNDPLTTIERVKKDEASHAILTAAKLISPVIYNSFSAGYNWCVDAIQGSSYTDLAYDLEINKAVTYLKQREFAQAIETLKAIEKKETKVASVAATNLSFLYFWQNDIPSADKYADVAISADRYNPDAWVNKGSCIFALGEFEKAGEYFREALNNEATCVEAIYNLGLTYKRMNNLEDAQEYFLKLHNILRNDPEVVFQIANIYELLEDYDQANEWYQQLISLVPNDPKALQKIGELAESEGDKQLAYQYHLDSYRNFPSSVEVIEWLGAYFIDSQLAEKAIDYFERAAIMQPDEVKWKLMIASCYRRSGNYQVALQTYKTIHRKFPENIECLKFLVRLCSDMGLKEAQDYAIELKKAEKAKEVKERVASSRPASRHSSSRFPRGSSASSEYLGSPSKIRGGIKSVPGSATNFGSASRANISFGKEDDIYEVPKKDVDVSYSDPLGPQAERPKTSVKKRDMQEDEFENEELGDDMLPE
uniref:Intraflagellar transport protein 88 homolog n=1 Tax=Strigamia maritima TaxID=126957 RepID=T1IRH6_STRMM